MDLTTVATPTYTLIPDVRYLDLVFQNNERNRLWLKLSSLNWFERCLNIQDHSMSVYEMVAIFVQNPNKIAAILNITIQNPNSIRNMDHLNVFGFQVPTVFRSPMFQGSLDLVSVLICCCRYSRWFFWLVRALQLHHDQLLCQRQRWHWRPDRCRRPG